MAQPRTERSARRPLDEAALARVAQRLLRAPEPPWLHGEAARRMAERLPLIKLQPRQVLDWGSFLGASLDLLRQAYPAAKVHCAEPDALRCEATAAQLAQPWWRPRRWAAAAPTAGLQAEVPAASAQLLWSNMQLHAAIDPQAVMAQWQRALAADGFLMFSTFGPGTLAALRELYAAAGWPVPMAPLVDMHDLGDMLLAAGFADPVMDQETLTLSWASPQASLAELRGLGGNIDPRRHAGLRTPRWLARLHTLLQKRADATGRIALDFELVFGHAFKPQARHALGPETRIALDEMRALVRQSGKRG